MISMIASVGKNMELGKNNNLIWHFKEDMKFFKETTMGHKVIMGRKTYESLPGNLPGREMIVISTKTVDGDVTVFNDINSIVDKYKNSQEEIFIIGGASIYKEFLPYASKIYLTEICAEDSMADTFFPSFNKDDWNKEIISENVENNIQFKMCLYQKYM